MAFKFIPKDWKLSPELREWTKQKRLTDQQIEDEIESFMDWQYKVPRERPDACWRNWVKNGIKYGKIETHSNSEYRKPDILSPEQKRADVLAFDRDVARYKK